MALYGLISGEYNYQLKESLEQQGLGLNFPKMWETTLDLVDAVAGGGNNTVSDLDAILIIDSAFENIDSVGNSIQELIEVQNMFISQDVENVKIYVVTSESNLYKGIKNETVLSDPLIYRDMYVMYIEDAVKLTNIMVKDIFNGKYDTLPETLRMKGTTELSKNERIELEMKKLREESEKYSDFSEGINSFNELSLGDSIDSKLTMDKIANLKREEELRKRHPERYQEEEEEEEELPTRPDINFGKAQPVKVKKPKRVDNYRHDVEEDIREEFSDSINVYEDADDTDLDKQIRKRYATIKMNITDIVSQKLLTDEGIISFVGNKGSGTSGLVVQTAEVYASLGRKVLVVDLDTVERSQTIYFSNYDKKVSEGKGSSDSLLKAIQGVNIEDCAVPVTSNIDVLSIGREYKEENEVFKSISPLIRKVLVSAKQKYDIVLLDIPLSNIKDYIKNLNTFINRNVFVIENTFYSVENMFAIELNNLMEDSEDDIVTLVQKSVIILNKYQRGNRDSKGYEITIRWLKDLLQKAGLPYDTLLVAGEIPYYDDWEKQYLTNRRRVLTDMEDDNGMTLALYRSVIGKIVI